jgi:hypothetical protein
VSWALLIVKALPSFKFLCLLVLDGGIHVAQFCVNFINVASFQPFFLVAVSSTLSVERVSFRLFRKA